MKKIEGVFKLSSLKDTEAHAKAVAEKIKPGSVIILQGDLGVGKTQWARFFIQNYLKSKKIIVNSPSYSLLNEYEGKNKKVIHMDLYRINDLNDLESTGFWDFLDKKNIICLEWGLLVPKSQLQEHPLLKIEIKFMNEDDRELTCLFDV